MVLAFVYTRPPQNERIYIILTMVMSSTLLRTSLDEHTRRPNLVCQAVNRTLVEHATDQQFATVFLGILEPESGTLLYDNAGHNPPALL